MTRIIITLLYVCVLQTMHAQEMPSVANVTFGWSYEKCKLILDNKYNKGNDSYQEGNVLIYSHIQFAGRLFDLIGFYFQNDGKNSYLSSITVTVGFPLSKYKSAEKVFDNICDLYSSKYKYRWGNIDDGIHHRVYGNHPKNHDDGFVVITFDKEDQYHVTINYANIDFVDEI